LHMQSNPSRNAAKYYADLRSKAPVLALRNAILQTESIAAERGAHSKCVRRLCTPHLVSAMAAATPDAIALQEGSAKMTYGELDSRSNRLAGYLVSLGVKTEVPVAICLERSFDYVVAALAVWKAGGAYLPLDPQWPKERREFILEDAQAPVLITRADLACRARFVVDLNIAAVNIEREQEAFPAPAISRDTLAYVIYTSGSTGRPKGVEITHGNLLNLIFWHRRVFGITSADCASHLAGLGFDASVWELWPYLSVGASIGLVDDTIRTSPDDLRDWISARGITMAFVPTTTAEPMLAATWPESCQLRFFLTGADTLHRFPARDLPFTVINNYGPTECTVVATSGAVRPGSSDRTLPPIGAPIANTQVYILDQDRKPVPAGTTGEIYIGGSSVARGYRNRAALSKEKFVENPFTDTADGRMYRSGDLGCLLPDGQIAFRGRIDDQEKIRGHRIEADEIASVLNRHPRVASCTVVAIPDGFEKKLAGYVVLNDGPALEASDLRDFLSRQLPEFMVPSVFVQLRALPLDSSGKLDRAALPAPSEANALGATFRAPESLIEIQVASILAELLRVERVSLDDNSFLLGEHSVLGAQLVLRVRQRFGVDLAVRHLSNAATVASLSAEIKRVLLAKLESMSDEEASRVLASLEA
jgi:amino acid adenylation domain-containing protein